MAWTQSGVRRVAVEASLQDAESVEGERRGSEKREDRG
jgi:hypothetical protein